LSWTFIEALDGRLGGVAMLNPARPHAFAKSLGLRSKTDRIDACVLALYGQAMTPRPTAIPTLFQRQLRELSRLYDLTLNEKNACENRLREPIASPFVLASLHDNVQRAKESIARIEKEIDGLLAIDGQLEEDSIRMQTIPGVGPKTARALLAQFGDLRTYKRNELVALVGVYPRSHQSGTSVYKKGKLARGGGARQRGALYMAALCAMHHCPHMKRYAQRLRERGFTAMVILGAIMRKLLLLIRTLIVSGNNYDPNYALAL
jgi:transposase